jgi:hypothetical protein
MENKNLIRQQRYRLFAWHLGILAAETVLYAHLKSARPTNSWIGSFGLSCPTVKKPIWKEFLNNRYVLTLHP